MTRRTANSRLAQMTSTGPRSGRSSSGSAQAGYRGSEARPSLSPCASSCSGPTSHILSPPRLDMSWALVKRDVHAAAGEAEFAGEHVEVVQAGQGARAQVEADDV